MNSVNRFHITAYSTALFSTWYFVEPLGLLFDCGDGITAALQQRAHKIKHVFLSHAHRDHIGGLIQFHQLNARDGLRIYYPADSGSFPALERFCKEFDPHVSGSEWIPVHDGQEIQLQNDIVVRAQANRHIQPLDENVCKSLSYFVDRVSRKLKPEFIGKNGTEIAALRKQLGQDAITNSNRATILAYSGDTPCELDGRWNDVGTLIHESTFLTSDEVDPENPRRNRHCSLDQVLQMVRSTNVRWLILGHFSSRYDVDQILEAVRRETEKHGIEIPISLVLPGQTSFDVMAT